jgi:hypothetical protein
MKSRVVVSTRLRKVQIVRPKLRFAHCPPKYWCLLMLTWAAFGCSNQDYETRPFFQREYGVQSHGRKTVFDHLVELDPGNFVVKIAPDYLAEPPSRIAVLPFMDIGRANFVVDKVSLSFRNKRERERWAWTHAQRLRRALDGYLAEREFVVANLDGIDAVLQAHGIDNGRRLIQVSPQDLGRWLGVDAVVYGTVQTYEAYYLGLIAAWRVGLKMRMVSAHTGKTLVYATGMRYDTNLLVAATMEDIAISSAENLLQLRDVNLARSEEETCREIVRRIPISRELQERNRKAALELAASSQQRPVRPDAAPVSAISDSAK